MYDPNGNGDREFVEIYNGGDISANLGGMTMVGVDYTFAAGTTLGAGQYGVIARNLAVFRGAFPAARVFGQYQGKLLGSGESVRIMSGGVVMSQVDYMFGGAWPTTTKNGGPSLSLVRPEANEALAACWAPSAGTGGTPGSANSVDGAWVGGHGGGCSNKAYPTVTQSNTSTGGTSSSANTGQQAQQQAAAQAQQKAAEQAKKQEEQKVQLQKQAEAEAKVVEQAQKQAAVAAAQKAHQSKVTLILAITGSVLAVALAISLILYKKLHHHRQFKAVVKEQEASVTHEKKS